MKKSRFTEAQIVSMLQQYDSGMKVTDICRDKGITTATFYSWKRKYAGMDAQQLKELKSLQEENRRLKQMYADLSLDHRILKDIIEKKLQSPVSVKSLLRLLWNRRVLVSSDPVSL